MFNNLEQTIAEKFEKATSLMDKAQLEASKKQIHNATIVSAFAGAVPLPIADALPISIAQITMVINIGKVFNEEISATAAKGLIAAAAATFIGCSIIKFVPIIGWITSATVAAGITEAIGWTIATDFARNYRQRTNS